MVVPGSKSAQPARLPPVELLPQWRGAPCRHGRTPPPKLLNALLCSQHYMTLHRSAHTLLSPPHCFLLEPLVYVVHTNKARHHADGGCLVYSCRRASASTSPTCSRSVPSGWLEGWLYSAALPQGLTLAAGPFLQLAAARPGSYFSKGGGLRNLATELPYGSSMAYGRCDRVLLQYLPTQPTQQSRLSGGQLGLPSKKSTQWHASQQRFRRQLHQSVAVAPCPCCGTCPTSPASPLSPQRHEW